MSGTTSLQTQVEDVPHWYHTMELAPGVVTPGFFDLRPMIGSLPWPDLRGKRCLDVATFDGFYAFEMERRGAEEVVAIDLDDAADLDWLPRDIPPGMGRGVEPVGQGFHVARQALGSSVERVTCNAYDLDPLDLGRFDVIVCGALLQHLRDPMGALLAIRALCDGYFLSVEHVDATTSLFWWHTPVFRLVGHDRTWTLPNTRGHLRMLEQTGFDLLETTMVGTPFGKGHDPSGSGPSVALRRAIRRLQWRLLCGDPHPPFSAALTRPAAGLRPTP